MYQRPSAEVLLVLRRSIPNADYLWVNTPSAPLPRDHVRPVLFSALHAFVEKQEWHNATVILEILHQRGQFEDYPEGGEDCLATTCMDVWICG